MPDTLTTDHDEIRRWAEERDAVPAVVLDPHDDEGPRLLRFDIPGHGTEDELQRISWEEFFDIFDDERLAMVYQEETSTGERSFFSEFVSRDEL
ncbi:MAG TPA: hypothetical protein VK011_08600 [Acidimicrobiia bacterium]|nr:hypothetical protein [Acidimicrobiia bacterium]